MANYFQYLHRISEKPETWRRKLDYIRFNFGKYIPHTGRVLDIGPGLGECIDYITTHTQCEIDILDIDSTIIAHLEKKFRIRRSFLSSTPAAVSKKLDTYDLIVATQIVEHIPIEEVVPFIKTLYNHLTPNGHLLITVPNGSNPLSIVERYSDFTHVELFTENSLHEVMTMTDLEVPYTIKGYHIPPTSLLNWIRIGMQVCLHALLKFTLIINGGVYFQIYTPNITLVVSKKSKNEG